MLSDRQLPDEELARAHRHAAGCHPCRKLLVALAQGGFDAEPADREQKPGQEGIGEEPPVADGPVAPWTPPMAFDEFRLERPLGRGGMGFVYLAQDTELGRPVAVKFIADSNPKPWALKAFEEEARSISPLQHPNVVCVYRTGKVDGHPYIVSEYIKGRRLADLPLPIPWRQAMALGVGLARGLAAAHRLGVLHRDIKPSNALVTAQGVVKLLDFGLAERFEQEPASPPSGNRLFAGTPPYMAPEVLNGAPATPQSDIYALGLVLHELCIGSLPSREPGQAMQLLVPAVKAPSGRTPIIDPEFVAIIQRCLAINPRERFTSADALCDALERLDRASTPAPLDASNPYRGLAPFEAEHRALFFGRDSDIRAVLERLRYQPLVLVAGDSGAGKSSLCRAGVLPRVAASVLDESREMSTVTLWPGRRPLEALAAALAPFLERKEEELVTLLADTPAWLGRALREAHQVGRGLLLFIDQLEELITVAEPAQAAHVARILGELALPAAGVRVLLAVRGDFLTRVCALPGLGDAAARSLYILRPLSPEGVREAVAGPARSRGVVFESKELVQTLVASTAHGAGSLPLLQFALAELWERRDPVAGCITREALDEMGGVAGALSRHADGVLARLSPIERDAARRLLLRLVTAEGTRVERSEEELVDDSPSRAALRALIEGRLLHTRTAGGESRCEIAHDSLIGSWGTLRDWLDDDIGHKVVRKRLEAASTEWERLNRAREALWGQRQLDEARSLDPLTLGPREHAFLEHSLGMLARQRRRRWLAATVVTLAIAVSYGGPLLYGHLKDARFVAAHNSLAREALIQGRTLAAQAGARRDEALALFDGRDPLSAEQETAQGPHGLRDAAERRWAETLVLRELAEKEYARASRELERSLDRDRGHEDTRRLMAEVTYERVLLAERFLQWREREERAQRLVELTDTSSESMEWLQRLQAPAEIELVTEPPGANVTIERYVDAQGVKNREPVPEASALGPTPIHKVRLPEGSYHLRFTHPDRAPVDLPLLLTHGAREQVRLTLPVTVPEGYRYIPPSCFLLGSFQPEDVRSFMQASPMHRYCLPAGYFIGQTEVTFGDWLAYLEAQPKDSPVRRILEQPRFGMTGRAVTLRQQPDGDWSFSFYRSRTGVITAKEGEDFIYPERIRRNTADWRRFPLSGVSADDLVGYFYWLDQSGRLPGARLCSQLEWEYAARGADGRRYPHGDQLLPDDANIDVTYGRRLTDYGPDEVGAHPTSVSPFGLVDMAGNALELTRSVTPELGRVVLRGGSWYFDFSAANLAAMGPGDPTQRDAAIGVRVCASVPPR